MKTVKLETSEKADGEVFPASTLTASTAVRLHVPLHAAVGRFTLQGHQVEVEQEEEQDGGQCGHLQGKVVKMLKRREVKLL